ncbi:OPT family small oligopeptide transporter [Kwoniella sp. DSM 27419]
MTRESVDEDMVPLNSYFEADGSRVSSDDSGSDRSFDSGPKPHVPARGSTTSLEPTPNEVRAVVIESDDPSEPCETLRAYVLGSIVAVIGTGLNVWFGARQPGIYVSPFLAQLLSHPIGVSLARQLPPWSMNMMGWEWSLNPGPWTIKEHGIVVLMATVSFPTSTALDIIVSIRQKTFLNDQALGDDLGFQLLVVLSTQFLGFGIAGLARDYLVYPTAMTWPINLAKMSLFNALHGRRVNDQGFVEVEPSVSRNTPDQPVNGWKISMYRFCLYAAAASFAWLFITALIFPALTYFDWPTWLEPDNRKLAILMGSVTGLGLNPLPTFDWTYISGAGLTPLITPWWATLSTLAGASVGYLLIVGIYFSNTWYTAHLVPNSNQAFDRFGKVYNVTAVLGSDRKLDIEAFRSYSPLYFGAGYNVLIMGYFASYTAVLAHALLNHYSQLQDGFRLGSRKVRAWLKGIDSNAQQDGRDQPHYDIHHVLMSRYEEAPLWWFAVITIISLAMGITMSKVYGTIPVWGIFVCLAMATVFLIPVGIIMAISNMQITLVTLAEIIPGLAIPGDPIANMTFKMYAWVALVMALLYCQDQKLAQYLHIPPRATFRAQMLGCLISSLVSLAVINWQFKVIPDLCEAGQKDLMTCPYYTTFYSSALLFGVVGPGHINVPVIIYGTLYFAPYNWSFVWAGIPPAWFFMSYVYKRYRAWWNKYCYILSIGLTVGAALSGVVQFFLITYPGWRVPAWWGNTVHLQGCDGKGCPWLDLPEVGYFGPGPGEFT